MLAFVSLLLLVIGQIASSDENCDKIEGLKPFNRHQIYECTFNGFFADETDRKCRQYVVCARNTRSFTTLYLTCPKGTYFNPDIEDCTSNYDCPYEDETESTTDISAACNYTSDHDYFRCYDSGNFANDNDPTCRSYFYCLVILKPNLYVQIKYTCSENFYFNPYTKTCDDKYVCSCSSSTSRPTSTTRRERTATSSIETTNHDVTSTYNGCDYIDDPDYFTCTVEGTFKNNNDRTCRSYYKCTNLVDGWIKAKYNCLGNTYFDPSKGHCNSAYKCPCSAITEQPAETTISPVVSEITSQQRTTNGESDTCIYSEDPNYFTCTVQGRFRNNNDKDCKSYYLCRVLRSGQIIQKKYDCPGNSLFNPKKQLCDMKYKCPCINLSTSTISTETSVETTTTINDETLSTQISTENTANENQSSSTSPSTTTTTTENSDETKPNDKCIYDDNPDYFTCTVKGRFRNNNDQNCKSYYLCSVLRSGRIIQTKYECPGNALFNPKKQLCDVKYKCPCYNPSTSTIGTNPATTEILVETTTTTINDDTLSTEISTENTSNENQSSSTSQSTTTTENSDETKPNDKCIYDDNPNYFTCTVKGRFRNNNDRNCKSYYLCSVLRSGRIIQTKYDCPGNSLFNPKKQLCDVKYKCPCTSTIDTTTIRTETSMETTTTTINDDTLSTQISTEKTTNEDQTSPTSPSITTTTENSSGIKPNDKCIYDDNPNYFTCTVKGRFRNNNDRNCKSYYLCSVLRSERIIQTKYDCPGNSLFNPKKQLCDVKYKCPCIEEFSTTISPTETSSTAETSSENSVTSMSSEEPEEASTSSEIYTTNTTKDHSTSNSASPRMSTPNQECVYDENPNYFTCTVPGRFRNNNDMECKSYYLCILLRSGRIYQTKYDCPGNSLFNPEKQLCDTEYKCPCYNPSTSTISTTTNETETSMKTTTTTANDDTLSTQISTEKTTNNDQSTSTLPTIITTETSNGTNPDDSCIYDDNPNYFTCTVKGRFRNNNDRECKSYYLCSVLRSGRIIQTKYDCPENSFFNPKKQLCDVKYKCPCTDELTTTTVGPTKTSRTAETTGSEDPEEASTSSEINTTNTTKDHSTANSASPRTSTINQECVYDENPNYFTCTVPGRFRNNNDMECKSYYLCILLRSGRIYQTKYDCPGNSLFNPEKQLCDTEYKCPCNNPSTSTISTTTIRAETSMETTTTTVNDDTLSTQISTEKTTNDDQSTSTLPTTITTEISNGTNPDDSCIYDDNPNYFTCTIKGRFRNNNDRECKSYYLCSVLRSGRIIQTKYDCPENSFFNPKKQLCDVKYKCPCTDELTTTTVGPTKTSRTAETTGSEDPEEASTSSEINTTNTTQDHSTANSASPRTSTINQECVYDENPNYFTCTVPGRFRNNNDMECKSYYLCILLRSGRIYQTKYDCPGNSLFNPEKQLCDTEYKCPCNNPSTSTISTTTIRAETSMETTTTTVNDDTLSTQISTEKTTNDDQSTSTLPTTITTEISNGTNPDDSCIYDDNPNYFTCTIKGRFRNNNDRECKSYYLCSVLRSGRIIQTKYDCPENSFFNPKKQLCDVKYKCPCTDELTTTTVGPTKTSRTAETTGSEDPEEASTSSEINTTNTTKDHSTANSASPRTSTINQECVYDENPNYFTCTVPGRFRNNNDMECKSYYLCILLRSGRIYQTKYDCPGNSLFNPEKQLCDTEYKCPCNNPSTSTISTTTIRAETSMETTTTTVNDDTLSTQISTEKTTNDDQSTSTLPTTITTEISNGTNPDDSCIYDDNPNYFTCTIKGRFRNNNDRECKSYYLCSVLRSGRIIQTKYDCPENSFFNPKKQLCDVKYKCPCTDELTTTTVGPTKTSRTAETTGSEDPEEASTSSEINTTNTTQDHSTANSASPRTSTINQECVYDENPNYFTCTVPGRFRNNNDMECKSYYLCILLRSGRIYQTKYDCPGNSLFNPEKQLCDTEYKCPCNNPSTSTISTTTIRTETSMETTTTTVNDDTLSTQISTEKTTNDDQSTSTLPTTITTEISNRTNPDDSCIYDDNPNYFTCTVKGRFRNNNDRECKSYYLCSVLRSGRIIQTKYDCPENSFFNPKKQLCDVKYKCPCTDELTTTTVGPTKTSRTAETTGSEDPEEASTSSEINTTNTTKDHSTTNSASPRMSTPNQECVYDENPNYFTCTVPGRFRNNNDMECKSYYLCILLRSGRIYQTKYDCPGNSLFNPEKQLCDTEYKCPCTTLTTIPTSTTNINTTETTIETAQTTTSTYLPDESTTTTTTITTILPTTTTILPTTAEENCAFYDSDPNYFICNRKGRFRNNNDKQCKTYFLCSKLRSGLFLKTKYLCPVNSFFNPGKSLCDVDYKCEC